MSVEGISFQAAIGIDWVVFVGATPAQTILTSPKAHPSFATSIDLLGPAPLDARHPNLAALTNQHQRLLRRWLIAFSANECLRRGACHRKIAREIENTVALRFGLMIEPTEEFAKFFVIGLHDVSLLNRLRRGFALIFGDQNHRLERAGCRSDPSPHHVVYLVRLLRRVAASVIRRCADFGQGLCPDDGDTDFGGERMPAVRDDCQKFMYFHGIGTSVGGCWVSILSLI